ncbi:sigma factor [Gracilibacillus sp. YIM 98692]|uniref:sigma factor n=1 Tax=Gracilibacillus sp. YIM 98692 TaxID=2663532 RepID=UPI0013D6AE6C|nr:sigma factor [Gracilibacillus sp. YIM 98692]
MNEEQLSDSIAKIKQGDERERNYMIQYYQPYILSVVGKVCREYKTWNDDEASIGLIAFNKALDTFEESQGRTFLNYAYLLIHRELVDYFRKENRYKKYVTNKEKAVDTTYDKKSIDQFQEEVRQSQMAEEILALNQELSSFYIKFEELESYSPKHKRTRKKVLQMAKEFITERELVEQLFYRKKFPMKDFAEISGYRLKTVEKHRKYLITIIIILVHPDWPNLQSFVSGKVGSVGDHGK